MTPLALTLKAWFAITDAQAKIAARLYDAGGEIVDVAELRALSNQTRQGFEGALQMLRKAMDAGSIRNEPGVGYRMSPVGLRDCRRALADARECAA